MKFERLLHSFQKRPFFETKELTMLFDEPAPQIQARLSHWVAKGKLIQLRRGRYTLSEKFWYQQPSTYYISNYLYRPSYVSLHSALEFHGLIPEAVGMIQALTPKQTQRWITPIGTFHYRSIKQERFFGYRQYSLNGKGSLSNQRRFLMAFPEKALLDLFYLSEGEWTSERIEEMRIQNLRELDFTRFQRYAKRFNSPKVERAAFNLLNLNFRAVLV